MSFSLLAHLKHPHVVALQESFFDPAEEQLFIVQVNYCNKHRKLIKGK